ncbi:MAG: hypothetical protein N2483_01665 [Burkholderiaceae bacterium]|nr:hypothetical protein [Burkholderiaceae bacterium]
MLIAGAAAFLVTVLAILALRPAAHRIGLVDRPRGRKMHHGDVPLVGGLAMFLAFASSTLAMPRDVVGGTGYLMGAAALLVAVGGFDDRFELSASHRLVVHLIAILVGSTAFGTSPLTLGDIFGTGSITLHGLPATLMLLLLTVGTINAMNMIDGADGVAGSMALAALLSMALLAAAAGDGRTATLAFALAGAVCGFLIFNLPMSWNRRIRCFMGDAGSTMLGFALAWVAFHLTQVSHPGAWPVTVLRLAAIPLYDLLWSIGRRVKRRRSPFSADRGHLHHVLLDGGLSATGTFAVLTALAVFWSVVGIGLEAAKVPEWLSFALFLCGGVRLFFSLNCRRFFCPSSRRTGMALTRQHSWRCRTARPEAPSSALQIRCCVA